MYIKKTKIIATIGPATESREVFAQLVEQGLNVARLNFSHGGYDEQLPRIQMIKQFEKETGIPIGILLDTKGPEIRTKSFKDGEVVLEKGSTFTLTTNDVEGDSTMCSITYDKLPQDVKTGDTILVNDGIVVLNVLETTATDIVCSVVNGGTVKNKRGINVPGIKTQLPAITEKDIQDIQFGIDNGVDFIAASFIRNADGVKEIRELLNKHNASHIQIVSKIECCEALEDLDAIIEASDGIMVARGDLGVEIETFKVPIVQKMIIEKCNAVGKPVITATHMLDSMIHNPIPTRAEATDVANAVFDGTDAVMLSGETTIGSYPVETVKFMSSIVKEAEQARKFDAILREKAKYKELGSIADTISYSTCTAAHELNAKAIICPTTSGYTAKKVAKFTPECPIYAFVRSEDVQRNLMLHSGVTCIFYEKQDDLELMIHHFINLLRERDLIDNGDLVIITAGLPFSHPKNTNMTHIHIVE